MDESELLIQQDRAAKARALLGTPLLAEIFDSLEAAYIDAWKGSPAGSHEDRERAWMAVRIIAEVRIGLERIVTDGEFAAHALDALRSNSLNR